MSEYKEELTIAPFPVKRLAFGLVQAKLEDLSAYLKEWSHGKVTYADARYAIDWLKRIGVKFNLNTATCDTVDEDENFDYYIAWKPNAPFQPVAYENAWAVSDSDEEEE